MKSTIDLHDLNKRLDTWRNRGLTPWLTWTAGGILGVVSAINQWPPCLELGNIIALSVFGTSTLIFFTIRRAAIKKLERKIKGTRQQVV